MKFETINQTNKKKWIIASIVVIAIIVTLTYISTRAKYRITNSAQLASGTINYSPTDFEIVSIKIQNSDGSYKETDTVPTTGYELNTTKTVCKVKETKQDVTITYTNGKINISNLTTKGTKCEIYFDRKIVGKDLILSKNTVDTSRANGPFNSAYTTNTAGKIFSAQDDDGTTYFFAGASPNNWVQFGGFYWRIIRINGDGSIRMIYNGTSTSTTGTATQIGTSKINTVLGANSSVGYMWGSTVKNVTYAETHANTNDSTLKDAVDAWYEKNIKSSYEQYIDQNAGFCGDRSLYSGTGIGTSTTYYAPYNREYNTHTPTYKCSNKANDLYSWKNKSNQGNKALINPVGLITIDEAMYAGGYDAVNTSYWLYTGQNFWTISPAFVSDYARVFYVDSNGHLYGDRVGFEYGVRPVINLKADVLTKGSGTTTDPYRVS